jgi:hypothetical protein
MTDALKTVGRGLVWVILVFGMIGASLKFADWLGYPVSAASPTANMTPEQVAAQRKAMEDAYTVRAIAQHKIPPGTSAMCDAKDALIGYYMGDRVVVYDDARDKTPVQCW